MIVAHAAFDDVVHAQVDAVVTVSVPVAPAGEEVLRDGAIVNTQLALGSEILNERPAIVSVAVRDSVPVFAAALYATVPDPVPVAPLVIVAQLDPLEDVQLQLDEVVTVTVPVPPVAGNDALAGEMVTVQGPPGCVTVNVRPAIVIVPVRDVVSVFAATL